MSIVRSSQISQGVTRFFLSPSQRERSRVAESKDLFTRLRSHHDARVQDERTLSLEHKIAMSQRSERTVQEYIDAADHWNREASKAKEIVESWYAKPLKWFNPAQYQLAKDKMAVSRQLRDIAVQVSYKRLGRQNPPPHGSLQQAAAIPVSPPPMRSQPNHVRPSSSVPPLPPIQQAISSYPAPDVVRPDDSLKSVFYGRKAPTPPSPPSVVVRPPAPERSASTAYPPLPAIRDQREINDALYAAGLPPSSEREHLTIEEMRKAGLSPAECLETLRTRNGDGNVLKPVPGSQLPFLFDVEKMDYVKNPKCSMPELQTPEVKLRLAWDTDKDLRKHLNEYDLELSQKNPAMNHAVGETVESYFKRPEFKDLPDDAYTPLFPCGYFGRDTIELAKNGIDAAALRKKIRHNDPPKLCLRR